MSTKEITFYNSHRPVLEDGDYQLTVEHKLTLAGSTITNPVGTKEIEFFVSGPRFAIESSLIHSSYPPAGGKGDYRSILPSLVLNRSTLPWERSPIYRVKADTNYPPTPKEQNASWLFLLLIDESEAGELTEHKGADLKDLASYFVSPKTNTTPLSSTDLKMLPPKINYLTLDSTLGTELLPQQFDDLEYLSYARIEGDNEEQAVILCNRVPKAGSNSTVYLVSVENNYSINKTTGNISFDPIKDLAGNYILPYLHKWDFKAFDEQLYCITDTVAKKITATHHEITSTMLSGTLDIVKDNTTDFNNFLTSNGITSNAMQKDIQKLAKLPGSDFHELLSHLPNGFEPLSVPGAMGEPIGMTGSIEFPFDKMDNKSGSWSMSPTSAWYRGPLTAASLDLTPLTNFPLNAPTNKSPQRPEDLIITDTAKGIDDTTYAAAYELGRLTAVDNVAFATEFYKWKSEVTSMIRMESIADAGPLTSGQKADIPTMPENLVNQFKSWQALKGIPYRYLVPDPSLLPEGSIRYFYIDPYWLNAFTCGAFSIGHTIQADLTTYLTDLLLPIPKHGATGADFPKKQPMGFLINSFVVSGWPNFQVDVHFKNAPTETITHREVNNLDVNIAFFLFDRAFDQLDFHLHKAKVHAGLLYDGISSGKPKFKKYLNKVLLNSVLAAELAAKQKIEKQQGKAITEEESINITLTNQTIDPSSIAENLIRKDPAHFAAAMLEGTTEIQFIIKPPAL